MKKVGTNVNFVDLMTKPSPRPKIDELRKITGYQQGASRVTSCKTSVSSARCRMKFDRGVLAVGHGTVSDTDCWMVRHLLQKCSNSRQDLD